MTGRQLLLNELQNTLELSDQSQEQFATTLFYEALIKGYSTVSLFDWLQRRGAKIDLFYQHKGPYFGLTTFHIAAHQNNQEICAWLLQQGIPVIIPDMRGKTALSIARVQNYPKLINYLEQQEHLHKLTQKIHELIDHDDINELEESVTQEHWSTLKALVNEGADINGVNQLNNSWRGDRPLHTLLLKGNLKLINWFMENGADPLLVDIRRKETPWQRLCRASFDPIVVQKFIIRHYAEAFQQQSKNLEDNIIIINELTLT